MLLALKIAVFYGAPMVAVGLAIIYFAVLFRRVRRGAISRRQAAARYAITLLLPVFALLAIWGTAEVTGYVALPPERRAWHAGAAVDSLLGLLPLALYVGVPIVVLAFLFWGMLLLTRRR